MMFLCAVIFFMAGDFRCNGVTLRPMPPVNYAPPTIYVGCESFCSSNYNPECAFRTGPTGGICHLFPCLSALNGHNCDLSYAGNASEIMTPTSLTSLCSGLAVNQEQPCNATIPATCLRFCSHNDPFACSMRFDSGTLTCRKFPCRNAMDTHNCNLMGNSSARMSYFRNSAVCQNLRIDEEGTCNLYGTVPACTSSCSPTDPTICATRIEQGNRTCRKFLCRDDMDAFNCNLDINNPNLMVQSDDNSICHPTLFEEGPCIYPPELPHCTGTCYPSDPVVCGFRSTNRTRGTAVCKKFLCRHALDAHNCPLPYDSDNEMLDIRYIAYCNHVTFEEEGHCSDPISQSACSDTCSDGEPTICSFIIQNSGSLMCRKFLCRNALDAFNCNRHGNISAYMYELSADRSSYCSHLAVDQLGSCNRQPV